MTSETVSNSLFEPGTVFVTEKTNKLDIFKEISTQLLQQGLVTTEFLDNLINREENYPTGIDLSVISSSIPNIAIPHTESEFVHTRRIIPIKLMQPIPFNNMIAPTMEIPVKFLFMILNDDPEGQSNILARIMDFLNHTSTNQLIPFFKSDDPNTIYQFLKRNF